MSVLSTAIDILSRPEYGRAAAYRAYEAGRPILPAYWAGFKGEEKETIFDILREKGVLEGHPIGQFVASVGLNLLAPEEWVLATGIGKIAGTGLKALSPLANTMAKTIVGRAFSLRANPVAKLAIQYKNLLGSEYDEIFKRLQQFGKGLSEEDQIKITKAIYNPSTLESLSPRLQSKTRESVEMFYDMLQRDVAEGIITPKEFAAIEAKFVLPNGWRTYVPGVYGRTKIAEAFPRFFSSGAPGYTKAKSFANPGEALEYVDYLRRLTTADTLEEAIAMLQKAPESLKVEFANHVGNLGRMQALAKTLIDSYTPEMHILKLLAVRGIQQTNAIVRDRIVRDILNNADWAIKALPGTTKAPAGWSLYFPRWAIKDVSPTSIAGLVDAATLGMNLKKLKGVERWLIKDDIASEITKFTDRLFNDKELGMMIKYYDNYIMKPWKIMATAMRLPFHIRNFMSNLSLAWYAGVNPFDMPKLIGQASKMQLRHANPDKYADGVFTTKSGVRISYDNMNKIASQLGILGSGAVFGDQIVVNVTKDLESALKYGNKRYFWLPYLGRKVGLALENNGRYMTFLNELYHNIPKGWVAGADVFKDKVLMAAKNHVTKHMYDYSELTTFEREVLRRVIPFYAWIRKNVPQQIENSLLQPFKRTKELQTMGYAQELVTADQYEKGARPEFFDKFLYIKTPFISKAGNPIYMHVDLPVFSLAHVGGWMEFARMLAQAKSPFISFIQSNLWNVKDFPELGVPIERYPGERVPAPFYAAWLSQVPGMNALLNIGPHTEKGKEVLGIGKHALHNLMIICPFLNELGMFHPQTPELEEKNPWRIVSYLTGITFMPLDIQQQQLWKKLEEQNKLADITRLVKAQGKQPTTRQLMDILTGEQK